MKHKWHKEDKWRFLDWYDRFFLQSPINAQLEDDVDKMYEAWKGGQQSMLNNKEPLSDDEIKELWKTSYINGCLTFEQKCFFARSIEKAHGIGEDK